MKALLHSVKNIDYVLVRFFGSYVTGSIDVTFFSSSHIKTAEHKLFLCFKASSITWFMNCADVSESYYTNRITTRVYACILLLKL